MKIKYVSAAVILSLAMASASAENWYVVGSVGSSHNDNKVNAPSLDNSDTGGKLQLGYKFTPNFAVEGGYTDLGKFNFSGFGLSGNIKAYGWNIDAVGIWPITDQWSVFGKVGAIDAKVENNFTGLGNNSSTNGKGNYGIGATYNITKQWGVRAEAERFSNLGDNNKTGENNYDLYSVGAVFNF